MISDVIISERSEGCFVVDRIYRGGTVADISDDELLRRVVKSLIIRPARRDYGVPLWSAVRDHFALGSTYAAQLCRRFEFSADQMVRKPR